MEFHRLGESVIPILCHIGFTHNANTSFLKLIVMTTTFTINKDAFTSKPMLQPAAIPCTILMNRLMIILNRQFATWCIAKIVAHSNM